MPSCSPGNAHRSAAQKLQDGWNRNKSKEREQKLRQTYGKQLQAKNSPSSEEVSRHRPIAERDGKRWSLSPGSIWKWQNQTDPSDSQMNLRLFWVLIYYIYIYMFSNHFFAKPLFQSIELCHFFHVSSPLFRNNLDHDGATSVQEFLLMARKASQMVEEANQITAEVKPGGYLRLKNQRWFGDDLMGPCIGRVAKNLKRCGDGGYLWTRNIWYAVEYIK